MGLRGLTDNSLALDSSLGIETTVSFSFLGLKLPVLGNISIEGEGERERGLGTLARRRCGEDRGEDELGGREGAGGEGRVSATSREERDLLDSVESAGGD